MSDTPSLGVLVAFAGGLLSFLSPCVLPLVPSYLGFVTGFTFDEMAGRRRIAMVHAALFVAGFSLVFMLFGASATALGRVLKYYDVWFQRFRRYLPWVQRASGALLVAVGLLMATGQFTRMAGWLQRLTPDALRRWL